MPEAQALAAPAAFDELFEGNLNWQPAASPVVSSSFSSSLGDLDFLLFDLATSSSAPSPSSASVAAGVASPSTDAMALDLDAILASLETAAPAVTAAPANSAKRASSPASAAAAAKGRRGSSSRKVSSPSASSSTTSAEIPTVSAVHRETTSGAKKIVEEPCVCLGCGSAFSTMILRGTPDSIDRGYAIDVLCVACSSFSATAGSTNDSLKIIPSRKRARGRELNLVNCDVCRRHIGSGGVKVAVSGKSEARDDRALEGETPDFSVEVVCVDCRDRYAFCTECGGGGKYRTGKYRPTELFSAGRRTCNLSHVRFGDAHVSFRVHEVSSCFGGQLPESMMEECRAVFEDGATSFFCNPRSMESTSTRLKTLADIKSTISSAWCAVATDIATAPLDCAVSGVTRYLATAYIPRIPRKKTRGSSTASPAAAIAVDNTDETALPPSPQDNIQAALMTAELDANARALRITHFGARMMAMQSHTLTRDLARRALLRANRDLAARGIPEVAHVCVEVEQGEGDRMAAFCQKLGAMPLASFTKKFGAVDGVAGKQGMDMFVMRACDLLGA